MFRAVLDILRDAPAGGPVTRFIVVSLPRTGTHMLRTLLNQHPNIRTETELFNEHSKLCRKWRKRSAPWMMENIAWRNGPQHIRGCTIHLTHGYSWGIWQYLMGRSDVRYLCLRRFNLLQQYLSLQQARTHQRWQTYRHQARPPVRAMSFKPQQVERYFQDMAAYWDGFEQAFSNRPRCDVWYEELCHQTESVSRQAQTFLGAASVAGLQPETIKVGCPARELISNYDELCRYFAGTQYQAFFAGDDVQPRRLAA